MTGAADRRSSSAAALEAVATAAAGAALAGLSWSLVDGTVPAAIVGGSSGAFAGWRGIYGWPRAKAVVAFVLDSTWALPMAVAGLVAQAVATAQGPRAGLCRPLTIRSNRHVFAKGFRFRPGFAITLGNTVNNVGDDVHTSARRQKLVTDHEDVHVWQARWLGPLYPVLYVAWTVLGGAAGAVIWVLRRRHEPFGKVVETCSYYLNPLEWWAYSRDDRWPPRGKVQGIGWTMPVVCPLADTRRGRRRARTSAAPGQL